MFNWKFLKVNREIDISDNTSTLLKNTLLAIAVAYMAVYLIVALLRIRYPFELEWLEGRSVTHILRILSGQKLYVSPSLEFVPFTYTPLYFYLSAFLSPIFGEGFLPLRFVSFISSILCFLMVFLVVKKETESTFFGIIASCLFAATFERSGAWFDLARGDSLFLFFLLVAIYLLRFKTSIKAYIIAGMFISLSFLTKQTVLAISIPIMFYCFLVNRIHSLFLIGTTIIIIGASTLTFNYMSDGWYDYHVFQVRRHIFKRDFYPLVESSTNNELPIRTRIIRGKFVRFFSYDLAATLPIAFIVSLYYLFANIFKKKYALFYLLAASGMFIGSLVPRVAIGGGRNNLFPLYAIISILFGLGTHMIFQSIKNATKQKVIGNCFYLVFIAQFVMLMYNPIKQVPQKADLEAGRKIISKISKFKGEVLVYNHGYLAALAGKNAYFHHDALSNADTQTRLKLKKEIAQAIRERKFDAIIIDSPGFNIKQDQAAGKPIKRKDMIGFKHLERYYMQREHVFSRKDVFWPITGFRVRPEFIFVPNS